MTQRTILVQQQFAAALDQPVEQRERYLTDQHLPSSVLEEVRALLAHDTDASAAQFLTRPVATNAPILAAGDRIGPYTVIRLLGSGGMGEVYLVQQGAPLVRQLALKLIRWGLDIRQVVQRFDAERKALARMDHPGIARVFAADATEHGQPFFVMEFIDGPPITEFCERHELDVRQRIELFLEVCAAIQHAHVRGVIHRDLKPSNILVSTSERAPKPKVIDFGLARETDPDTASAESRTAHGQLLGTPEFMSPEQVSVSECDTDTRSDVYALGAVLYLLLAGRSPFEALCRSGDEEMRRRIREEMPPPPSRYSRAVDGDLDAIVDKALAKDRTCRYQAVSDLAADLRRQLAGLPVLARSPGPLHRLRKFIGRHPGKLLAAAAMALIASVGLVNTNAAFADAAAARHAARETLDSFYLLALDIELRRARHGERPLYPAWPEQIPALQQWLTELAEPLVARSPRAHLELKTIRDRALPYDDFMRARDAKRAAKARIEISQLQRRRARLRERDHSELHIDRLDERIRSLQDRAEIRATYSFTNEMDHALHDSLALLIGDLSDFCDPDRGLVARAKSRLTWAREIHHRSIDRYAAQWQRAITAVDADQRFNGFHLTPQIGLVPIGVDPRSGLQEFAHLRSGAIPRRDPETSRLQMTSETAMVFVLLPGTTRPAGLDAFFLAKYELTQGQWMRLGARENPSLWTDDPTRPVDSVSWFAGDQLLRQHGLTLPTAAQWRHGAGPGPMSSDSEPARVPVTQAQGNALGLHGLTDSVQEWCLDAYDPRLDQTRPGDGLLELAFGRHRIVRGGLRGFNNPNNRDDRTGLRPARRMIN